MTPREIYLDHNVLVDAMRDRKSLSYEKIQKGKDLGWSFPYSPFHLEEVAIILFQDISESDQLRHIHEHLDAIRFISDLQEYLPGGDGPVKKTTEDPFKCLTDRVLKDYWITSEGVGIEEFLGSLRSSIHFNQYAASIGLPPKENVPSWELKREQHGIPKVGLTDLPFEQVLLDPRVTPFINEKLWNYGLELDDLPRGKALRISHDKTERVIGFLTRVLNEIGYWTDPSGKHRSFMFDVGHLIYGIFADEFIIGDRRFYNRARAVYHFLGAETSIRSPEEFAASIL